jgi:ATP-dependent DNA helicase RecG
MCCRKPFPKCTYPIHDAIREYDLGISLLQFPVSFRDVSNPKPELKEMTGAFVVKFTRRPASEGTSGGINEGISEGANEGINRLLEFIQGNSGKRVVEIATALNVPSKTVERWIKKLREQGRIVFVGPRKTGGYHSN